MENLRTSQYLYGLLILTILLWAIPGQAAISVEFNIEGLTDEQKNNVLNQLTLHQQKDHPLTTEAFIRRSHKKSPIEIQRALEPFGYYQVKVASDLRKTADGFIAHYQVVLGPPLLVQNMDLILKGEGRNDFEFRQITEDFPLKVGDVAEHVRYEEGKTRLLQEAMERGYLDATFTQHELRVDLQSYQAQIILHFNTGIRYQFGDIRFHQDILKADFLERFSPVNEGDNYSVINLLALQKALSDSGYFLRAEVTPRIKQTQNRNVPIDVNLTPRKRNRYTAGIGYGTNTGARAIAGWEIRRVNQRGHRVNVEMLYSEIKNSQTLRYTIPLQFYQADQLALTANRVHEWHDDRDELSRAYSISRSKGQALLRTTTALTYTDVDFTIGGEHEYTRLLIPSINWTLIDTDDRLYTTHGSKYIFDLRGTHSSLFSDISFIQAQAQGKWITQFANSSRLITRASAGYTNVGEFDELPSSLRFFTGGDKTIRGYRYQSIGPVNASGTVIGGKNLILGSIEYEYPLVRKWSAAIFYDAGNVFDQLDDISPIKHSVGIGTRWRSIIGLIRADIAWPQDDPDHSWRFHLVIGPDL